MRQRNRRSSALTHLEHVADGCAVVWATHAGHRRGLKTAGGKPRRRGARPLRRRRPRTPSERRHARSITFERGLRDADVRLRRPATCSSVGQGRQGGQRKTASVHMDDTVDFGRDLDWTSARRARGRRRLRAPSGACPGPARRRAPGSRAGARADHRSRRPDVTQLSKTGTTAGANFSCTSHTKSVARASGSSLGAVVVGGRAGRHRDRPVRRGGRVDARAANRATKRMQHGMGRTAPALIAE